MEVVGILLSLVLLIFVAYRGYSVIFFAPIFAVLAAVLQGLPVMPTYTELFMAKAVTYVKNFFPVFMLGAVFGKIMEETGMAKAIAHKIFQSLGPKHAMLSTVLAAAILTYGGVSMFVVVFAVYPFAAALFKEADIPKKLLPATIVLGAFTFTMDSVPGSPQIQNLIPANFLGTSLFSAPVVGIIISLIMFSSGMWWLLWRAKSARVNHEGYGDHTINEPKSDVDELPGWQISLLPLILVLVVNYIGNNLVTWDPAVLEPMRAMKLPLMTPALKNVVSTWSLIIGLVCAIALATGISFRRMPPGGIGKALSLGAIGSLLAIMNVASEVGYGNVIAQLPGFNTIANAVLNISFGEGPLVSEAVTINILCGVTGSASGGVSIALDLFGKHWQEWAAGVGMTPEVLHRMAAIASGGLDTGPHNGAIITLLAVCGMSHRQSYPDIFAMTILKTVMVVIALFLFGVLGLA
jgi:H+/gluconate symporter-like permease